MKLSMNLNASEGYWEPVLALCQNPKCLKETTEINFNHVLLKLPLLGEWGWRTGQELHTISRHVTVVTLWISTFLKRFLSFIQTSSI